MPCQQGTPCPPRLRARPRSPRHPRPACARARGSPSCSSASSARWRGPSRTCTSTCSSTTRSPTTRTSSRRSSRHPPSPQPSPRCSIGVASDRARTRRPFIAVGYILWGLTTAAFGLVAARRGRGCDGAGRGPRGRRDRGARLRHVVLRLGRQRRRVQRVGDRVDRSRQPRPRRRRARDHAAARHADRLRRPGRAHQGRTVGALLRNRRRCDRGRRGDRMVPRAGRARGRGDHRRLLPGPRVRPAAAHDRSEPATLRHACRARDLRHQHPGVHSRT